MQSNVRLLTLAGISAASLIYAVSAAHAGAFALREQSAVGQGMSFAGVAAGSGGLSSMYWNPATITMSPGFQTYSTLSLINLDAHITPISGPTSRLGGSGQIGEFAAVPATNVSYQLNDRVWLGLSVNAPLGLVTKPNYNWAGQAYGRTARIFSTAFNPVIGIKINEWLSIGGGLTVEYLDVKVRQALGVIPNAPTATVRGRDWEVGWTAGATITPFAGTSIGIGYRSSISHNLSGYMAAPGLIPITGTARAKANIDTPDILSVGLTQALAPNLRVNLGYEFQGWSRTGTIPVVASSFPVAGRTLTTLPLRYKDGHLASAGIEYDYNANWTFRTGFAYEWSPIPTAVRSVNLPDADRIWASVGASYRVSDKITVDVGYSHGFVKTNKINLQPGNGFYDNVHLPFYGKTKGSFDIVSLGLKYRWDSPAVAQPAAIVTRY